MVATGTPALACPSTARRQTLPPDNALPGTGPSERVYYLSDGHRCYRDVRAGRSRKFSRMRENPCRLEEGERRARELFARHFGGKVE